MAIDENTVRRIARLACIAVSDDALAPMAQELDRILAWVAQLDEVDTDEVEPMTGAVAVALPRRADRAADAAPPEDLLANAPAAEDDFFVVPKVIE